MLLETPRSRPQKSQKVFTSLGAKKQPEVTLSLSGTGYQLPWGKIHVISYCIFQITLTNQRELTDSKICVLPSVMTPRKSDPEEQNRSVSKTSAA